VAEDECRFSQITLAIGVDGIDPTISDHRQLALAI